MKPGAILLNVARGGVIDEAAVADGAGQRAPRAAPAIDVFETEPPTGSPLLDAPNTLLTPHLGASTAEAQVAVAEEVADQVLDVLAGRSARYAVNAPLLTPETAEALAPYLPLAETLGRFFAQFARTGVRTLTLEIAGELAAVDGTPLDRRGPPRAARDVDDRAGQPRQRGRAREGPRDHGRRAQDARRRRVRRAADAVRRGGRRDDAVGGTVAGGEARLTRLNDYRLDMGPSEVMLITHHRDRPGMIGRIGQTLGEADVNISAMHVGRSAPRADALMILALDDDVSPAVADAIRAHDSVIDLWTIRLGTER